jgi:hypothetical protein
MDSQALEASILGNKILKSYEYNLFGNYTITDGGAYFVLTSNGEYITRISKPLFIAALQSDSISMLPSSSP